MKTGQLLLLALVATRLGAQESRAPRPIQDNSFFIEEAYNQERAVVQHINTLFFDRSISGWAYSLTDEWPVGGQRHQLSLTVPLESAPAGRGAGFGDLALNYRMQLVGSGDARLAVAPRITALFPTASARLGGGTFGVQGAVASSYVLHPEIVMHTNVGVTLTPHEATGAGSEGQLVDLFAGQSIIWLARQRLNVLVEGVLSNTQTFTGTGLTRTRATGLTLSPGLRWSYDFASGLQVVPGIAAPFGFRANRAQRGVFLYLSFEHRMPGLK